MARFLADKRTFEALHRQYSQLHYAAQQAGAPTLSLLDLLYQIWLALHSPAQSANTFCLSCTPMQAHAARQSQLAS